MPSSGRSGESVSIPMAHTLRSSKSDAASEDTDGETHGCYGIHMHLVL